MLTRLDIHDMCSPQIYARGLQIQGKGSQIIDFDVSDVWYDRDTEAVSALVIGQHDNTYFVDLVYNPESDSLSEVYCSCPAFESYDGICKHCVAVLLEYSDYQLNDPKYQTDNIRFRKKRGKGSAAQKPTTFAIKNLLESQQHKMTLAFLQKETYGRVNIEPEFIFEDYTGETELRVKFKLGIERMYVMKSVYDFAKRMNRKENFYYGKKLEFVHSPENFTEKSKDLAEFIQSWAEKHPEPSYYDYYRFRERSNSREPDLSNGEIDDFFDLFDEKGIMGTVNGQFESIWKLKDGRPKQKLTVSTEKRGIEVSVELLSQIKGEKYAFSFDQRGKEHIIYRVAMEEWAPLERFFQSMKMISGNSFFIEKNDVPVFCRELLPELKKYFDCELDEFYESDYGVVPVEFSFYLDAPEKHRITCKIIASYDEKEYNVFRPEIDGDSRDLTEEGRVITKSSVFFDALDESEKVLSMEGDDELIYDFLTRGVDFLEELGVVYISEALKRVQIKAAPAISVGVSLSGDLLNLTLTCGDMSRDDLVDILSKYDRKKKFYRLKNGDFIRVEDSSLATLAELKDGLNLTAKQLEKESIALPKYRALYLDNELHQDDSLPVERSKYFKALIRDMKTVDDNDFEIPESLEKILREYQKKGFMWLKTMAHNGFGGILADDMGLGKTLQVITFMVSEFETRSENEKKPFFIVCPASLVYNWASEIERFAPQLSARLVVGNAAERRELIREIQPDEVVITSYELLKRDIDVYDDLTFSCQVIDEAQYIKNPKTQAAKTVKKIKAGFKLALTGTPIENRLSELWSIFDYLMPGFLYGYEKFRRELEKPIVETQDEQALQRLQKMIRPFVLRRLKGEVLRDLPEKIEENYMTRLEGEQQQLYDAHVKELQMLLGKQTDDEFNNSKIKILSAITRLRQLCCDPALVYESYSGGSNKVEMCVDLIANAAESGHKILLFSQFTSIFEILEKRLKQEGISYYVLTGATKKEERMKMVKRFNEDKTSVFLISLKAGGTGLNLTAADIVIHFDPWWNVAAQNQATDRAHRIGQKKVVNVYKLIARGTIEENILKLQEQKKELAEQLLSGDGIGSASFSREELLALLG